MQSSFTIHAQELRFRFLYCVVGWCVCLFICNKFVDRLMYALLRPYLLAVLQNYTKQHINQQIFRNDTNVENTWLLNNHQYLHNQVDPNIYESSQRVSKSFNIIEHQNPIKTLEPQLPLKGLFELGSSTLGLTSPREEAIRALYAPAQSDHQGMKDKDTVFVTAETPFQGVSAKPTFTVGRSEAPTANPSLGGLVDNPMHQGDCCEANLGVASPKGLMGYQPEVGFALKDPESGLAKVLSKEQSFIPQKPEFDLSFLEMDADTFICLSIYMLKVHLDSITGLLWTNITEALIASLHCCWVFSFWFTWPVVLYSLWSFLIPGFTLKQRHFVTQSCLLFVALFLFWQIFLSSLALPYMWNWLLCFDYNVGPLHSIYQAKMWESVQFITNFLWWSSLLGALIPLFVRTALHKGWLYSRLLVGARRIAFFLFLILSSIVSPPDLIAQISLSILFGILYENIILFSFLWSAWQRSA